MSYKYFGYDTLSHFVTLIKNALSGKVDKVTGMGLSENNYTTSDKNKLAALSADAQENLIETIAAAGTVLSINNKTVNVPLANGGMDGLMSKGDYTKLATINDTIVTIVSEKLSDIQGISYEVVTSLPAEGQPGTIYLIADAVNASGDNIYKEYIWVKNTYELIGTTEINMDGYAAYDDLQEITSAELRALWK